MKRKTCEFYNTLADLGFKKDTDNEITMIEMKTCSKCGHRKVIYPDYKNKY